MPAFLPRYNRPAPRPVSIVSPVRLPIKRALVVGINYIGTSSQLSGCINDVKDMRSILQGKGYSVISITDETHLKPTNANIVASLVQLTTGLLSGDKIVFHYSGHGTQIPDRNGDEPAGLDSAIVPLDYEIAGSISDDTLRAIFSKVPANVDVFSLIDACHSGTSFDSRYQYTDASIPDSTQMVPGATYNPDLWTLRQMVTEHKQYGKTNANIMMISACLDQQYAADTYENKKFCGALTWAFMETFKVTSSLKYKHLLKDISARLRMGRYSQTPQLSCGLAFNGEAQFVL